MICIEALKLGYEIVQVLMTNGEYGTKRREFRGKRLRAIRARELERTLRIYEKSTATTLRLIKMNYIDGHLPLNKDSLNNVTNVIKQERPDIIFAPDPYFPIDFHPDHLKTGYLPCFALKHLEKEFFPRYFFLYYSFNTNKAIKCRYSSFKILTDLLAQHRSQVSPYRRKLFMIYVKLRLLIGYARNNG